ncbi:T9SS type A sorting domain-containing protein [Flavobacterium ajazii]|uniref:T9SS type A sorting domain-containing protein n=1 Tax=Flavobacterium ajazii TaxID=2692318 RepID=UPI0013D45F23|nr:T9SS type A sorting domain-containing protein [Flavobacterium ajazii]
MKKELLFVILLFSFLTQAQQKLEFSYDNAGNQITRVLCLSCTSKPAKEIKEIEALTEDDLLKFSQGDVISYYPNPVKEELYLAWQLSAENNVSLIKVFAITGQLLIEYKVDSKINSQNIPFQSYPSGIYAVLLNYSNGEQKSIKIIKE